MTYYRSVAIVALSLTLAVAGCVEEPDHSEESQRLSTYLVTTGDVVEGDASGNVELVSETYGEERAFASRSWRLGPGASPLGVSTWIETTVHDPEQSSDVFDRASDGNWTRTGSPGMGERSALLKRRGGEDCGHRVVVQVGNLVSVVDVEVDCAAFGDASGEAKRLALRLARRQATVTTGRPVSL